MKKKHKIPFFSLSIFTYRGDKVKRCIAQTGDLWYSKEKTKGGTAMIEEIILNNILSTLQEIQREMERQTELLERMADKRGFNSSL